MASETLISLTNLELYNTLLKSQISLEDAKAIKVVTLSQDKKKLQFYKIDEPVGDALPSYEIELPESDLSGMMKKVADATNGNIGIFTNGTIVDSGISMEKVMTEEKTKQAIQQAILQADHLSKQIVETVPSAEEAKPNVIYMVKKEGIESGDAYEEWMLIGSDVVQVGSTQTDLADYYTKEQVDSKITSAKTEAVTEATTQAATDAQTKADKALQDAKAYTDTKIGAVNTTIESITTDVSELTENVTQMTTDIDSMGDRITELESSVQDISTASEEQIRAMFSA